VDNRGTTALSRIASKQDRGQNLWQTFSTELGLHSYDMHAENFMIKIKI
jgi:hypothetical protein